MGGRGYPMKTMAKREAGTSEDVAPEQADDFPVSPRVLSLFQRIRQSKSKAERAQLMLEMASAFVAEHDPTDDSATDDYHSYIEEYEQAKIRFQQASLRVARLAMDTIDTYIEQQNVTVEGMLAERLPKALN